MVFTEVLEEVTSRVEGCIGLVVMGMDGIPIERYLAKGQHNFDMLSTEATSLLRSTRQASEDVGAGALKELIFMTETLVVMAVAITDDYVLLAALEQGTNYGKARFHLKRAAMRLEKEFV